MNTPEQISKSYITSLILLIINKHLLYKSKLNMLYTEWESIKKGSDDNNNDVREQNTLNRLSVHKSAFLKTLGCVLFILSILMVVAEMTIFLEVNLSVFGIMINKSDNFYSIITLTMIPLIYLINTTMYSLFHLKLSGVYGVYNNKQTDSESMIILTNLMCRIAFPLALNFNQILKLNRTTNITKIMGSTDFLPVLGHKFTVFYPTVLGVLCIFNYFNVFGTLLSWIGLSSFGFDNDATKDAISEGKLIFERSKLL